MSVLHDRIASQGGTVSDGQHEAVTAATPMEMPMSEIVYAQDRILYGTLHPLVTADGAVVAARSPAAHAGIFADVVPAATP